MTIPDWIYCKDATPHLGDYSVLATFENGAVEMVHVDDHFRPIGDGWDEQGNQKYTQWYRADGNDMKVIAWTNMPEPAEAQ